MTAETRDLSALAEKVEGLTGPCRETDVLVENALGIARFRTVKDTGAPGWLDERSDVRHLTASLDAVVALIEKELPEWHWRVQGGNPDTGATMMRGSPRALLLRADDSQPSGVMKVSPRYNTAATPALALLAAFLRAKGEQNGNS